MQSITFYEATNGVIAREFSVTSPQLTTRHTDPMDATNNDFVGVLTLAGSFPNVYLIAEAYDVFYSDADGTFNIDGGFLTVEATYPLTTGGGGLNIAEIGFTFASNSRNATVVKSFVQIGPNGLPGTDLLAVDGDLGTSSVMGSTPGYPNNPARLHITVAAPVSEGGTMALIAVPLILLLIVRPRSHYGRQEYRESSACT